MKEGIGMLNSLFPYKFSSDGISALASPLGLRKVSIGGLPVEGYGRRPKVTGEVDIMEYVSLW